MQLKIDTREKKLIEVLLNKDIEFIQETLDIGDITIYNNNKPIIIIERKTTNDLDCSIKDGRYNEQKYRLLNFLKENVIVMYLIEGSYTTKSSWSAQINTMIRDNIHVFRTFHIKETGEFIETLMNNLPKYIDNLTTSDNLTTDYIDTLSVKKKQTNKDDIYCMQLQQIQGISPTISKCISEKFSSWKSLISDCKLEELQEIKYKCKTGSERRIGKVVANRVMEFIE